MFLSEDLTGKDPLLSYFNLWQDSLRYDYKTKVPNAILDIGKSLHIDHLHSSTKTLSYQVALVFHSSITSKRKLSAIKATLVSQTSPSRQPPYVNYKHIIQHDFITGTELQIHSLRDYT